METMVVFSSVLSVDPFILHLFEVTLSIFIPVKRRGVFSTLFSFLV